ncbi:hypothetical protein BO78DRAFT_210713 [Aspergillus sclerotiicarbonarius CBS 121057]|uniref:DUF7924 domain-containing protein n=1 Tax=Aspergillus sclerotiicarbonarius (strain CBS 121057 / IBT 28362) TaxID=1448318 RepID=A0A319E3Z5_ASPSB|nr:hypothetical protein BO78DRAFT_210713 [Aspergillus sclerotiicarbonarius CBS 121057]
MSTSPPPHLPILSLPMKRARSCSPRISPSKKHEPILNITPLTYENLREHDRTIPPLSRFAVVDMSALSDVPGMLPPSTHSSSRLSSPSSSQTRPSDAHYRERHLRRANIFIEEDTPMDRVSDNLWCKCREIVRVPSGEPEWTEVLLTAINDLRPPGLEIVRNRSWCSSLKPPMHNTRLTIPLKRSQPHQLAQEDVNDGGSHSSPRVTGPNPPIFKLKDPRPDICVGLSSESISDALEPTRGRSAAQNLLVDLQETSTLTSDPHVAPMRLRFPFLVVETKSGATGGNLYQAQNQAAVSGSIALRIFQSLADLHNGQGSSDRVLNLAFSITTEGPIHELWLHCQRRGEERFYMVCVGSWRTTLKHSTLEFVRCLSAVLTWGDSTLREKILGVLQEV